MQTVEFKFDIGDLVITEFGYTGRITDCAVNSGLEKTCFVTRNDGNGAWYRESQLTITDDPKPDNPGAG